MEGRKKLSGAESSASLSMTAGPLSYVGVIVVTVVADLATKWLAHQTDGQLPLVSPARNDELALGILGFGDNPLLVGLVFVFAIVVLGHGFVLSRQRRTGVILYSLLVGGVLGNAIDRVVTGVVHDWLDLGIAVANVADFALLAGLVWYVVAAWRSFEIQESPSPSNVG